jgi:hypothetical protein
MIQNKTKLSKQRQTFVVGQVFKLGIQILAEANIGKHALQFACVFEPTCRLQKPKVALLPFGANNNNKKHIYIYKKKNNDKP